MAQGSLFNNPKPQFLDENGDPYSGGKLYFYETGTTTAKPVYSSSDISTALANPVILDSAGRANIWLNGYYKVRLDDSSDVTIWTEDNISSQYWGVSVDQYVLQGDAATYIGATQFSVVDNKTTTYEVGRRIKAAVTAGTIYGTIAVTSSGGTPTITTVTCLWDSGSLDSGLSAVSLGLLTVTDNALPIFPVLEKIANYTLAANDNENIIQVNSANDIDVTLANANAVPSGTNYVVKNISSGVTTIVGTVDGAANVILENPQSAWVYSDGSAWYTVPIKPSIPGVLEKTANYSVATQDVEKIIQANSASNIEITLANANAVSSGTNYTFKNINTGDAVIVGTIDGLANATVMGSQGLFVYSDGAAWRTVRFTKGYELNKVVTYTTGNGTYTPTTGSRALMVECVGAGGGGGAGVANANSDSAGGGGGAGGYSKLFVDYANLAANYAYAVGAGGSGGVNATDNAAAGANTTLGAVTANGGSAGGYGAAVVETRDYGQVSAFGGNGGVASNGDINITGNYGGPGLLFSGNDSSLISQVSGAGGSTIYGSGGREVNSNTANGFDGLSYGAGGGGRIINDGLYGGGTHAGNGSDGLIIITEYI